jgi:hypothetical protein
MKTITIYIITIAGLIGILALLGAVNMGGNNQASEVSGAVVLSAVEGYFDFGTVSMTAGSVKHDFIVKNMAGKEMIITKVYTSCMCTEANLKMNGQSFGPFGMPGHGAIPRVNKKIGDGEEAMVEAIFDPAAHGPAGIGPIERVVFVENDLGRPLELKFKATVIP